ncbi:Fe2+-dependent dioxygenase [Hyphobacterium marinum]|uniref:Fe2+-dependent dioxygenase n=1 Tax=Hyphobacterium marinum TaxID=3116574 RepID=A0ABU7LXR4_9PROT|nr:Fe2+-dependent dioxygenase [Hyphobacterium sp. Y6023]MEE2566328.1 Fe2+-dependent dioxygenase [Hyphobacterium sp. Y6023]
MMKTVRNMTRQTGLLHRNIPGLLGAEEIALIAETWPRLTFADGRDTAGAAAARVKHNEQAVPTDRAARALKSMITEALKTNSAFNSFTAPERISPVILSRYTKGMAYGRHVDDTVMYPDGKALRIDFSFTLFLAPPDNYSGGELVIEEADGEIPVKLKAGDAFVYASGLPHRVATVIRGERRAAVGWVQSLNPPRRAA